MAFYLQLERKTADGIYVDLYPELLAAYATGQVPKPNIHGNTRCQNIVRYEMFKKLGISSPSRRNTLLNTRRGLSNRVVKISLTRTASGCRPGCISKVPLASAG